MEMLGRKQNEERQKFREQMDKELQDQREQMNNMMGANMEQARQEREEFMRENQDLRNQFSAIQKANEENIKMIEKLRDLVDKHEEEKRVLNEQMTRAQAAREREELFEEVEERHKAEQEKLRQEMKAKMEAQRQALAEEYRQATTDVRIEKMDEMKERLDYVTQQLEEVNKPSFLQKGFEKVTEFFSAAGRGFVKAGAAVVEKVKDNCSVMWNSLLLFMEGKCKFGYSASFCVGLGNRS